MPMDLIRIKIKAPVVKAYPRIIALLDAGYTIINAEEEPGTIILVFRPKGLADVQP